MDPRLLDYYNRELVFMREKAGEFAAQHPKIAKRLGMQGIDVADPYVERLIEAFCFMSARTQIKLDAEFPRFTQRLLEVVSPNYIAPTPSISIAQFHPASHQGDLSKGFTVPKQTKLRTKVPYGEKVACEFRTGQDITLWPLTMTEATFIDPVKELAAMDNTLQKAHIKSALRIRLKTTNNANFADLQGLDTLPVYFAGNETIASHLFEFVHTATTASVIAHQDTHHVITNTPVGHDGFTPDQRLLPSTWNTFYGNQLFQEYFACPSRFLFFTLNHLAAGLSDIHSTEADIILLFNQHPQSLEKHMDVQQLALFCAPVINLFPSRTDRIEINHKQHEFHLVPDRTRPLDYEVYAVNSIQAQRIESTETISFKPLFDTQHKDHGNWGKYFSVRREKRTHSALAKQYGARSPYIGSEVFIALVNQFEAPLESNIRYLSVDALLTNRDLPLFIPRNGKDDLIASDSLPVSHIGLIRAPSKPKSACAEEAYAWRLIQQLNFHHQSFTQMDEEQSTATIRQLLQLFLSDDQQENKQQIDSIIGVKVTPVTRRIKGQGPLMYSRGMRYEVTVDETGFSGASPFLFIHLLAKWLSAYSAVNTFSEVSLISAQRGSVYQWQLQMGARGA